MLRNILQNIALLAIAATISTGFITEIDGVNTSASDANAVVSVYGDLDSPVVRH